MNAQLAQANMAVTERMLTLVEQYQAALLNCKASDAPYIAVALERSLVAYGQWLLADALLQQTWRNGNGR